MYVCMFAKYQKMAKGANSPIAAEQVGFKKGLHAWSVTVAGREFFLQPPPYPYCKNHFVLIERAHV